MPAPRTHALLPAGPHGSVPAWAATLALAAALFASPLAQADDFGELRALLARGDAATALPRLQQASAADPRDVQMRFLLGVALMDLQRDDEALDHFGRMAQDYPELPDPQNNIALLHARAGRLEPARQALETALRNDPTHRAARTNLGQVHLLLAVQAWELAAAEGPLDTALLRRLEAVRALLVSVPEPPRAAAR
jgi:tetratricopeptide (TPR) repeat protein